MKTNGIISSIFILCFYTSNLKCQDIDTKGVLIVDLMHLYTSDTVLNIYNEFDSVVFNVGKILYCNNRNYNIRESNTDTIKKILRVKVFEPDYDILILDCLGKVNSSYKVIINDTIYLIKEKDPFVKYETLENHLLRHYISLMSSTPLHTEPKDEAPIIKNFIESTYVPIEIKGNWLKVKCFMDCEGCLENRYFEGWVKWKDENGNLLVEIFYVC
jgi:hypothetical protein